MMNLEEKRVALIERIRACESAAVAFSGGVDSTFLLAVTHEALGERALAVTAISPSFPAREREEAEAFCKARGIRQVPVDTDEMEDENYRKNPNNRCYYCKTSLFHAVRRVAQESGLKEIFEGSNQDDLGDYRPGLQAVSELGIRSPLREVALTKTEIRLLSKEMGLATWDKPGFACLSSRIPYDEEITEKKLKMIERAENALMALGFRQVRCRIHGEKLARIEVEGKEIARIAADGLREKVLAAVRGAGFLWVTLDLKGYRTGAMNEVLAENGIRPEEGADRGTEKEGAA